MASWGKAFAKLLKQHLKTSTRKSELGFKWVFQMDISKDTTKLVTKWLKDKRSQCFGVTVTKSWWSCRKFVSGVEKVCESKVAYKLGSVLSGGMGQNSIKLMWEACGRKPKMFDSSHTVLRECYQILRKNMWTPDFENSNTKKKGLFWFNVRQWEKKGYGFFF